MSEIPSNSELPITNQDKKIAEPLFDSEGLKEQTAAQNLSMHTITKVDKFADLNADNTEQGNEVFAQKSKELWKKFGVHGKIAFDKTGHKYIAGRTDLDGKSSIGLFKLAGMDTSDLEFVAPGNIRENAINTDTGKIQGTAIKHEGKTVIMDHHGKESTTETSATKEVYETLVEIGLLKKEPYLDRLVEFVTFTDNKEFPEQKNYFKESYRNLLGLRKHITFDQLVEFFKESRNPADNLDEQYIEKLGLKKQSESIKKGIASSMKELERMDKNGLIIDSEKYGKIAIDIGKKVNNGFDAAMCYGCDTYIIWSPGQKSFIINSRFPLTEKFSQGINVRGKMWVKPQEDTGPVIMPLTEILSRMTNGKYQPEGELKEYIDKNYPI